MASLKDLVSNNKPATTQVNSGSSKPIGYINLKMMDVTLFSRPIWKESTSDVELFSEINEMALNEPDALKELFGNLFVGNSDLVTVEVSLNRPPVETSLADVLAAIKAKK